VGFEFMEITLEMYFLKTHLFGQMKQQQEPQCYLDKFTMKIYIVKKCRNITIQRLDNYFFIVVIFSMLQQCSSGGGTGIKSYKKKVMAIGKNYLRSLYPSLPSTKWTELWRFPLHPQSRNIWYRTLHNKLPCRSNLYMPSKICPICSGHEETPSHFLFECSQKLAVWSSLWDSQFELPFSTYSLRRAIFLLEFPKCRPNTSTVPSIFFGTFLLALWRNHWSFVFDGCPFLANIVIVSAKQLLFISLQESLPSNRVSPLPLPHVQLP
jgi:hypothetical protein